jgi:two-component system NarL family sensor kinase
MREQGVLRTRSELAALPINAAMSLAYLEALIEHSPIAIVVLDGHHRYALCNPSFEQLFQYRPDELSSCDLDALIAAPDYLHEASQLSRKVLSGTKVHTVTQRRRKDGMVVDVEIYGVPLIINDEVEGVYGLYQDVTDRNRARSAFQQIANKLETIRQEERRRFARDLHDSTSQELTVLNWNLTRLLNMAEDKSEQMQDLIRETKELAAQCSRRIRGATYLLHPPVLGEAGLRVAIGWLVEGFSQRSGLRVQMEIAPEIDRFASNVEAAIFRVVQEGLANVLRHTRSSKVTLQLSHDSGCLHLSLADESVVGTASGPTGNAPYRDGVGISGMRERIEQLGGSFLLSRNEIGTTITVVLPLERGDR